MTITLNDAVANDLLDGLDSTFNSGTLEIRTGAAPGANNAATGTVVASITLPADAFGAAASRTKAKAGTWSDASADAAGTAAHFRLKNAAGTRIIEGTVTATGGGGDMTLDNVVLAAGQAFTINTFSLTA